MKSNQDKYGRLVEELANDFNKGRNSYPATLTAAYEMMLHDVRKQDNKPHPHGNPGLNFHTNGGVITATSTQPNPRPDITCIRCDKTGHFSNKCRETKHSNGTALLCAETETTGDTGGEDTVLTTIGEEYDDNTQNGYEHGRQFTFVNDGGGGEIERLCDGQSHGQHKAATGRGVPEWWILLDNQSTVDVFSNKGLLKNIREAATSCRISCNAGVVETNLIGDLAGYPVPVWYYRLRGTAATCELRRIYLFLGLFFSDVSENSGVPVNSTMVVIDPATAATFGFDINSSGGAYQSGKAYGILKKIELVCG
jgi:hypothetical protein